ncbi:MAG: hypothetical protein ACYDD2_04095 [Candidatus Acidiferrales bacterium]
MIDKIEVISLATGIFGGVVFYCLARRGQPSLPRNVVPVKSTASGCGSPHRTKEGKLRLLQNKRAQMKFRESQANAPTERNEKASANRIAQLLVWLLAIALFLPILGAAQTKPHEQLTKKDLKQAIANAKTADDHVRIAQYYRDDASRLEREAKEHAAFSQRYGTRTGRHCRWLATEYSKKVRREQDLARVHEDRAKSVAQRHRESPVRR